ncbi:MAG: hypothetical protein P8Z79_19555 [Sedimentisphaerales bacterium]|jgi:hypothetical protein
MAESKEDKKLIRGPWSWTPDDIRLLKRLYPRGNTRMIAEKLCRPLTAVRQKAYDIGMKTDTYQYWSDEDLKRLTKLFPRTSTKDLAEQFDRSEGSIKTKARQLGLKKSKSYLKTIKAGPRRKAK